MNNLSILDHSKPGSSITSPIVIKFAIFSRKYTTKNAIDVFCTISIKVIKGFYPLHLFADDKTISF